MNTVIPQGTKNNQRKVAALVGILFIIGTVSGILSYVLTGPILDGPAYLEKIPGHETQVILGALCVLSMGLSLALMAIVMYPILQKHNQTLAIGYVVFRGGLEPVTYLVIVISWLLTIPLSREFVSAGAETTPAIQTTGRLLLEAVKIGAPLTAIVFPIGAIMFYVVLYQTRMIPRWLSIWGLAAVIIHLFSTGLAGFFPLSPAMLSVQNILNMPIMVQEMVMAAWFITRGFNPPDSTTTETIQLAVSQY